MNEMMCFLALGNPCLLKQGQSPAWSELHSYRFGLSLGFGSLPWITTARATAFQTNLKNDFTSAIDWKHLVAASILGFESIWLFWRCKDATDVQLQRIEVSSIPLWSLRKTALPPFHTSPWGLFPKKLKAFLLKHGSCSLDPQARTSGDTGCFLWLFHGAILMKLLLILTIQRKRTKKNKNNTKFIRDVWTP